MDKENVAAPPCVAVCDALPLPLPPAVVVKSITDCISTPLLDAEKSVSLLKSAESECVPVIKLDRVSVATPFDSDADPMGVALSRNVTVPIGWPAAEETIAVRVIGTESSAGFALLDSCTADPALTMVNAAGVLVTE